MNPGRYRRWTTTGLRYRRDGCDSAHRCGGFTLLLLIATVLPWVASSDARGQGAGNLVVSPTRIIFEGRTRTAQISLLNRGSAAATYRISVINMRMTENGAFKEIDEPAPGEQFADRLIRYAPRQVVLAPGGTQAVRLLLRKPHGLEPGEYRSHLLLRAIPSGGVRQSIETPSGQDAGIPIHLIPVYGVKIPVIVRHGDLKARVSLSDLTLAPASGQGKGHRLSFRINRDGNRSVLGDLTVTYFPNGGGRACGDTSHPPRRVHAERQPHRDHAPPLSARGNVGARPAARGISGDPEEWRCAARRGRDQRSVSTPAGVGMARLAPSR